MPAKIEVDILEDCIRDLSPDVLNTLLKDNTRSTDYVQANIFWATHDYEALGKNYGYFDPITTDLITRDNSKVIMPRVLKDKKTQTARIKGKAEVFTPSWVCNTQNNLIDEAWFGKKNVFNTETPDHSWIVNENKIEFPNGKTWQDYVADTRMEITCGEAPYLASRYDTTTGEFIPIDRRIGLIDRKLRVVSENATTSTEWIEAAQKAYKSLYAYEWQGDNLLLAREAMLMSFIEYYKGKFGKMPDTSDIHETAKIISWNLWQMDGLKGVVPKSCHDYTEPSLFDDCATKNKPCPGCKENNINKHNGDKCKLMDWDKFKTWNEYETIEFVSLLKR